MRDIWLLRLRALLARAHGDEDRLPRLSGSLPRHGEIAWLRGAHGVGRGDAMTAVSREAPASLSRNRRHSSVSKIRVRSESPVRIPLKSVAAEPAFDSFGHCLPPGSSIVMWPMLGKNSASVGESAPQQHLPVSSRAVVCCAKNKQRCGHGASIGSGKRIIRSSPARALSGAIRAAQDLTMGSGVCAQNRYSRAKAGVLKRSAELPKVLARNTIHG